MAKDADNCWYLDEEQHGVSIGVMIVAHKLQMVPGRGQNISFTIDYSGTYSLPYLRERLPLLPGYERSGTDGVNSSLVNMFLLVGQTHGIWNLDLFVRSIATIGNISQTICAMN